MLVRLKDYKKSTVACSKIIIDFEIFDELVLVQAWTHYESEDDSMILDGEGLQVLDLKINDVSLQQHQYNVAQNKLTLSGIPPKGIFYQRVILRPSQNLSLQGMFYSGDMLCTQCEPEGFRKILFSVDRPDVLSLFEVSITASKTTFPVLLSNGYCLRQEDLPFGRHKLTWVDPFKKPSYLFAVVAGDLALTERTFVTKSKKNVALKLYCDKGYQSQTAIALDALQAAMLWDEKTYGLEYDLDVFHIVASFHFNMGAMENKSLNIFNAKYVLGSEEIITDQDYLNIYAVVAHEYFHNWTGNRVTVKNWFELSLKEGLTVFREQQFMEDFTKSASLRIQDVAHLLAHQFPEDLSPMAHAVRPQEYQAIDNFYTTTVYEKGSEIIRMLAYFIGSNSYYAGVNNYLTKYDGQAVSIDDWLHEMELASGISLQQFKNWYDYPHAPIVTIQEEENVIHITQTHSLNKLFLIPLSFSFYSTNNLLISNQVVNFNKETIKIDKPQTDALISVNQGFLSPIILKHELSQKNLMRIILAEKDPVASWNYMQNFWDHHLTSPDQEFGNSELAFCRSLLESDKSFGHKSSLFFLPQYEQIAPTKSSLDPVLFDERLMNISLDLALHLKDLWLQNLNKPTIDNFSIHAIEERRMILRALSYAAFLPEKDIENVFKINFSSKMMTLKIGVLEALARSPHHHLFKIFSDQLFAISEHHELVMLSWLKLQASLLKPTIFPDTRDLMKQTFFDIKNPNKVNALLGTLFTKHQRTFHDSSEDGYSFWAEQVMALDHVNPLVAAKIAKIPKLWQKWPAVYQEKFHLHLIRVLSQPSLSLNTKEVIESLLSSS